MSIILYTGSNNGAYFKTFDLIVIHILLLFLTINKLRFALAWTL